MVKVKVSNDYDEEIYAKVYADKIVSVIEGGKVGANFHGAGFNLAGNKEVKWENVDKEAFTRIPPKKTVKFCPDAKKDTVYVTLFCEGLRPFCLSHPVKKICNVILTEEGCICVSKKNTIWEYHLQYKKKDNQTSKEERIYRLTQEITEKDKCIAELEIQAREKTHPPESRKRRLSEEITPDSKPKMYRPEDRKIEYVKQNE